MSAEPVRVALIGCGKRGRTHLEVIAALPDHLELVGICDRSEASQAEARRLVDAELRFFSDIESMVSSVRPELAIVALKSHVQPPACVRLLEAGVHVLTEVPPAFCGMEAAEMIRVARVTGLHLAAAENYPETPLEQLKRAAIARGVFGEVTRANVSGSVNHKGHEIATGRAYLGFDSKPRRISARSAGEGPRTLEAITVPGVMAGIVEFENGRELHLQLSGWGRVGPQIPIVGLRNEFQGSLGGFRDRRFFMGSDRFSEGWRALDVEVLSGDVDGTPVLQELRLHADETVAWTNPLATRVLSGQTRLPSFEHIEDLPQAWEIAIANLYVDMAEAVRGKREPAYPVERAMTDVRIRVAMLESTKLGGDWVDWQETPYPVEHTIMRLRPLRKLMDLRRRIPFRRRLRA